MLMLKWRRGWEKTAGRTRLGEEGRGRAKDICERVTDEPENTDETE